MVKTKHGYQYEHEKIIAPTQAEYITKLEAKLKEYIEADKPPVYTEHDGISAIAYHSHGSYCYSFIRDGKVAIGCNMVSDTFAGTVLRMVHHVMTYSS